MVCKESIGTKIKLLRKEKNFSQEKFAELIDISTRHIINIEMGYTYPSIETLQKISSVLNVSIQSFFDDEDFDKYYIKNDIMKKTIHDKIEKISEKNLRILAIILDNMI